MRKLIGLLCLYGVVIDTVFDWMGDKLQEDVKRLEKKYSR